MKNYNRKSRIGIMGAGAIGSVIGGMLARNGHKVTLVGRKPHIDKIRKSGLHISAGIPAKASDNIMREIWHKVLYNIALNPLSAIFQITYGQIADNPHTRWLAKKMINEAFQVAMASGQHLGMNAADEYLKILWNEKLPPTRDHRSSMLQDILRGKKTEIDFINGAIVRMGAEYGIGTPYNSAVVSMVKAKESLGHQ